MPARKPRSTPNAARARLTILAASGDDAAFEAVLRELLASKQQLDREAALGALAERPLPALREALRALYAYLDEDPMKRDQGAAQRALIVRILREFDDHRDAEIGVRAVGTREVAFGEDIAWTLRAQGLRLLAGVAPDAFPYYAVELLDDDKGIDGEPANTAFRLLAATGNYLSVYQWLVSASPESPYLAYAFELFADGPPEIVRRFIDGTIETAIRRADERLCTLLAEAIVNREIEASYATLARIMSAKLSDELYAYLAVLLASTNRPPLLAILEEQLHRGRPRLILDALRVRTTPAQQAIIDRWERGE